MGLKLGIYMVWLLLCAGFTSNALAQAGQDSISVRTLIDQSDRYRFAGDYDIAFDNLWSALGLAERHGDEVALIEIYRDIGILYDIYHKDSLAIHYLQQGLSLSKTVKLTNKDVKSQVLSCYFSIATYWRDRQEYELALDYLDSCNTVYDDDRQSAYVLTDQGYCNLNLGNTTLANKQLTVARYELMKSSSPYVAVNLAFTADLKMAVYQYDSALYYYQHSLDWIQNESVHTEFKSDILQKISDIYMIKNEYRNAIAFIKEAKAINDKLFNISSKHNLRLFEIKNKYKASLAEKELKISEQEILIRQSRTNLIYLVVLLGITITLGIVFYLLFKQRNKLKQISFLSKIEADKKNAVLEVKNKELTTSALKMIKMEENVDFLANLLKLKAPKDYNEYVKNHSHITSDTWDDFNQRFSEVNSEFYQVLCSKHSDLTPTELKHCALIKLNFNNFEMSKILNISLRSVHTSRYRIRKKMGLDSSMSLTSYIVSL